MGIRLWTPTRPAKNLSIKDRKITLDGKVVADSGMNSSFATSLNGELDAASRLGIKPVNRDYLEDIKPEVLQKPIIDELKSYAKGEDTKYSWKKINNSHCMYFGREGDGYSDLLLSIPDWQLKEMTREKE